MAKEETEPASSWIVGGLLIAAFAVMSVVIAFDDSVSTDGRILYAVLAFLATAISARVLFPNKSEQIWRSTGSELPLSRSLWGITLIGLAVVYIYSSLNPLPDDEPYLFAFLGACAAVAGGFCLLPKASTRIWTGIGIGVKWLWYLSIAGLIGFGIVSIIAGAPIPAAIIIGALIIAAAIERSHE